MNQKETDAVKTVIQMALKSSPPKMRPIMLMQVLTQSMRAVGAEGPEVMAAGKLFARVLWEGATEAQRAMAETLMPDEADMKSVMAETRAARS